MKNLTGWLMLVVLALAGNTCQAQDEELYLDPLGEVIVDMQIAGGRLGKLLTDKPTQQKQKDAIDKLDALIVLLKEQRRRQGGMGGNNPEEALQDSIIVAGPGGSGPLHAARKNGAAWGELPAHKRQEILQSMTEGFPPHYQKILEGYYLRLAEEKPAGETADDAAGGPAAEPAGAPSPSAPAEPPPAAEPSSK